MLKVTLQCRCTNICGVSFTWAAWYYSQLLIKLMPKGIVFSFLFFSFLLFSSLLFSSLLFSSLLFSFLLFSFLFSGVSFVRLTILT